MTHYQIRSGTSKPDLNPAAMFQAQSAPSTSGTGFDAALERARQAERPKEQAATKGAEPRNGRSAAQDTSRDATQAAASEAEAATAATAANAQTSDAGETRQQSGQAASEDEESTAGLPAEIAAIIAALAAGVAAKPAEGEATETVDTATAGLLVSSDERKSGRGGNQSAAGQGFLLQPGKATPTVEADIKPAAKPAVAITPEALAANTTNLGENANGGTSASQTHQGFAALVASRTETVRTPAQPVQLQLSTPAGSRGWSAEVGNQVVWMLGRNESKAELVLTPPSLGKLGVSIQVNGEQTTAHFVAASQAARDALEQAMPKLREVLQQAGIQLGQTNVSTSGEQRTHDGQQGNGSSWANRGRQGDDDRGLGPVRSSDASVWTRNGDGVIDTFA